MDQESMERCRTCPAFAKIPGRATRARAGRLRPSSSRHETYFRGSTRELPFGAFPVVGAFPLVTQDDYCMSHPGNRTKLM